MILFKMHQVGSIPLKFILAHLPSNMLPWMEGEGMELYQIMQNPGSSPRKELRIWISSIKYVKTKEVYEPLTQKSYISQPCIQPCDSALVSNSHFWFLPFLFHGIHTPAKPNFFFFFKPNFLHTPQETPAHTGFLYMPPSSYVHFPSFKGHLKFHFISESFLISLLQDPCRLCSNWKLMLLQILILSCLYFLHMLIVPRVIVIYAQVMLTITTTNFFCMTALYHTQC